MNQEAMAESIETQLGEARLKLKESKSVLSTLSKAT
jgi:hypothetical protein